MQTTRQRILEILKEKNHATVDELSAALDLTPVTIRHHLDILRGEGLIGPPEVLRRPGPGRPQYTYTLTEAADDYFPKNYHSLADLLFDEIRDKVTPAELEQIMNSIADRMADRAPSSKRQHRPRDAMDAAVRFLNDQGYVARWEETPDGLYMLHTCNCPYERVAQAHSEICAMDANFVGQVVGRPTHRASHMAQGDNSCSYVFDFKQPVPLVDPDIDSG
jgi:predicted ArsR family transcriptional regulator